MDLKELDINRGGLRHPWEVSRAEFFERLTRGWTEGLKGLSALDIGSGDTWVAGRLLTQLPTGSRMLCVDRSYTPEIVARLAPGNAVDMAPEIPVGQKFDLLFLLDVVEHVREDREFLCHLVTQHLLPGALVILSVPAYQSLYSSHDVWLEHFRRYSPAQGRALVTECGLELLDDGGLFHGLLYARLLQKAKEWIKKRDQVVGVGRWEKGQTLTRIIAETLNLDWKTTETLRRIGIKVPGLSWWCVCRKV